MPSNADGASCTRKQTTRIHTDSFVFSIGGRAASPPQHWRACCEAIKACWFFWPAMKACCFILGASEPMCHQAFWQSGTSITTDHYHSVCKRAGFSDRRWPSPLIDETIKKSSLRGQATTPNKITRRERKKLYRGDQAKADQCRGERLRAHRVRSPSS